VDDRLRALWDFDDLGSTEERLREQLTGETSPAGRAEVLTQLARIQGLRGSFHDGDALLDEAHSLGAGARAVEARVDLERGRLRRSSGDPEAARPLFESAYASALETEQYFLAADAAHMVALVAGDGGGFVEWTQRGVELGERHESASYWLGPLLNNLGWEHYDAGDYGPALDAFERFHEELAEEYAAVARDEDARAQAALAIPLLERDDPSFAEDAERHARLVELTSS
jgi:tetratricopeptide (TPR) repeat protein